MKIVMAVIVLLLFVAGCGDRKASYAELSALIVSENARFNSLYHKCVPMYKQALDYSVLENQARSENDDAGVVMWKEACDRQMLEYEKVEDEMAAIIKKVDETKRLLKEAE